MVDARTFDRFASYLEDTYGVQYDRLEEFVQCPECGDYIYRCDWEEENICEDSVTTDAEVPYIDNKWKCPICEEVFD